MDLENILFFCRTSDSSSLSRITDSIIPILVNRFNVTLLSNKSNLKLKNFKNVILGSDSSEITFKDYLKNQKKGTVNEDSIRSLGMKYALIQIVDLIFNGNYKYFVVCNGIYETNLIVKILTTKKDFLINKSGNKTKLIVWSPIDYIPSLNIIEHVINADLFLTMTPIIAEHVKKISNCSNIDWVGHGSEVGYKKISNTQLIKELCDLRFKNKIYCKSNIKIDDIIILNANNYGPVDEKNSIKNYSGTRKRLDITIKSFLKLIKIYPNVKLWIHTNLDEFLKMLSIENIKIIDISDNLIMSKNNLSDKELSYIYQACKISLQTSFAEGWSLTNMEASLYNSLQVVPNFLACGYHFKENRGILIPVVEHTIKNESDLDVIIGVVSIEDTVIALTKAIELLKNENKNELNNILKKSYDYCSSYTWENITKKLINCIENC